MKEGRAMVDTVHYVYVIKCSDGSHYVGCTNNLDDRIRRHNRGYVKSTSYRTPVNLVMCLMFKDKYKAYGFEKYLKTGSGRAFLYKRFV